MFKKSLSDPRFGTYLSATKGDEIEAIKLYQWNSKVSQSLYIYLQAWEVTLRNKVNEFLTWKYKETWPYDHIRAVRNFKSDDQRRLAETITRQERDRRIKPVATSVIVADLSAGFWVSQISARYGVTYSWRYNIQRVFQHEPSLTQPDAWDICNDLLTLRNRVAHHEPLFHLPLQVRRDQLKRIVSAMCPATSAFAEATCNFSNVLGERPEAQEPSDTPPKPQAA